jgi:hypothetical protein
MFAPLSKRTHPPVCLCCGHKKPRDGAAACQRCTEAGCRFSAGNWFRGSGCQRRRAARIGQASRAATIRFRRLAKEGL